MQPNDRRPPRHPGSYEPLKTSSPLSRAIVRPPFGDSSSQKAPDEDALQAALLGQGFAFPGDPCMDDGPYNPMAAATYITPVASLSSEDQIREFFWRSYLGVETAALLSFSSAVSLDFASMAVSDLDENSPEYVFYFSCAFVSNFLLCVASGLEARDTFVDFFIALSTGAVALGQLVATELGCRESRESDGWSLNFVDRLIIPAFIMSAFFVVPSCFSAFGIARDMERDSSVALIQEYPVLSVLAMVLYTLVTRLSGTRGLIGEALESLLGRFLSQEGMPRKKIILNENDYLSQARHHSAFKFGYTFVSLGLLYLTFSLQPFWLAKTKLDNQLLQELGASASNFFYMRAVLNFLPASSKFLSKLHGSDYCWLLLLPFVAFSGRSMSNEVAKVTCTKALPNCTVYDNNTVAVNYADSVIGRVLSPEGLRDFGTYWTFFVAGLAANGVGAMHLKTHGPDLKRYFWQRWNHYQPPGEGGKPDVSSPPGPFSSARTRGRSNDDAAVEGRCRPPLMEPGFYSAPTSPKKRVKNSGSEKVNDFVLHG